MNKFEKALDEHQKFIRRYNTTDLLEFFSNKSIHAYNNGKEGFTIVDVPYYVPRTGGRGVVREFRIWSMGVSSDML